MAERLPDRGEALCSSQLCEKQNRDAESIPESPEKSVDKH